MTTKLDFAIEFCTRNNIEFTMSQGMFITTPKTSPQAEELDFQETKLFFLEDRTIHVTPIESLLKPKQTMKKVELSMYQWSIIKTILFDHLDLNDNDNDVREIINEIVNQ